ncbi:MAG: fatty acid desaturase [SAR324 cluster bacterium]|nr:fatty acid desaturase [SAR324 cluster bacterium]
MKVQNWIEQTCHSLEWQTWGLILMTYTAWGLLINFWSVLPFWLILPIGACIVALHNSIQHEAIHNHPTHSKTWNSIIAGIPVNLWRPYGIYRDTHLQHHQNQNITFTREDPESYYVSPENWEKMGKFHQLFRVFFNTFPGRIIFGPAYLMLKFFWNEIKALGKSKNQYMNYWKIQILACIPVILWFWFCKVPFWQYFLLAIYPGESLSLIRSFAEHRAAEQVFHRIAIVESNLFFSLLFLNNNLHCVHHWKQDLPWYELPEYFQKNRHVILNMNDNYYFKGYAEIFKNYWNKPWIHPLPPLA